MKALFTSLFILSMCVSVGVAHAADNKATAKAHKPAKKEAKQESTETDELDSLQRLLEEQSLASSANQDSGPAEAE